MPYTIPEWFRPGPEFLVAPTYGVVCKAPAVATDPRQICFSADNVVYMSLAFHFGIVLLSLLALMVHDRMQQPRSKTDALRYAPPLSE